MPGGVSHRARLILLILSAAAVYLLGNDRVPLWDRDEPRNAQAARQMYQSGDWVVPRYLDKVRTAKPVLTYWCQAGVMHAIGDTPFAARLPSTVFMLLTLTVLAVALTRATDRERAFWTVFILATSAIVIAWTAKTSLTDSVQLLWITIAQLCLFRVVRGDATWPVVITMALAIGLAGLTKGPVVLGVLGATVLAWALLSWLGRPARVLAAPAADVAARLHATEAPPARPGHRRSAAKGLVIGALKGIVALMIVAAVVGPWLWLVERRAPGFLGISVANDVIRRSLEPLEQHYGPPGYYALVLWGIFMPWSVLLPLTFALAWRHRDDARVRFALSAVVGPWLLLEAVRTKLPHYLLPAFPPLAYLLADAIVTCLRGQARDLTTRGTVFAVGAWATIVAALGLLPALAAARMTDLPRAPAVAIAVTGVAYATVVFWFFLDRQPRRGLVAMGGGMMIVMALMFSWYLPRARFMQLSMSLADVLKQHGGGGRDTPPGDVQMIGYKEPSLAFYQGGTIREQPQNDFLLARPPGQWPRWLVVREDVWGRMPPDVRARWDEVGQHRGLNLADRGRAWTVHVLRRRPL